MKFKVLILILLIAAVVYFLVVSRNNSGLHVGQKAPSFSLPTQDHAVSLDQLKGKVVLLNFWATWCPSCVREIPSLNALYQKMKGKDFTILAVSLDEEGWSVVDAFQKKTPLEMTVLLDRKGDVASLYGTYQLPESYLIDKKGFVVQKYIGPQDWIDPKILKEVDRYENTTQGEIPLSP